MNLDYLQKKLNTEKKCLKHLELVRWEGSPICPFCGGHKVYRRGDSKKFHCNICNKDFTVLYGTIFEGTKLPLSKWFMLIALMLNARKGLSALQISRDIGVTYKTAWYSAMRVRCAMVDQLPLLEGIVEMDECYVGGKPRYRYSKKDNVANLSKVELKKSKRGRGTSKIAVVGIVERDGSVVTKVANGLSSKEMLLLLRKYVNMDSSIVMTDEFSSYKAFDNVIQHLSIDHSKKIFSKGIINTNTIEGYWSIIKNGIRGQYHVISKKYLPFYLVEFQYKYNRRRDKKTFDETIQKAIDDDKCLVNYKPKGNVKRIVYKKKRGA